MLRRQGAANLGFLPIGDRLDLSREFLVLSGRRSLVRLAQLLELSAILLIDLLDGGLLIVIELDTHQAAAAPHRAEATASARAATSTAPLGTSATTTDAIGVEHACRAQ